MRSFPPPILSSSPYFSRLHSWSRPARVPTVAELHAWFFRKVPRHALTARVPFSAKAWLKATLWPSGSVSTSTPSQSKSKASGLRQA